jgi:hypothetical protein
MSNKLRRRAAKAEQGSAIDHSSSSPALPAPAAEGATASQRPSGLAWSTGLALLLGARLLSAAVPIGIGRSVVLYYRASTLYHIH